MSGLNMFQAEDSWKKMVVLPTDSIQSVLKVLERTGTQIVFVTNASMDLLGSVTDGDIRRGLLRGISLSECVSTVMHESPIAFYGEGSDSDFCEIMQRKCIRAVPLVKNGRVVDIKVLSDLLRPQKHDNPVFLMAGGFGTRLSPLTDDCPKPLLNVGGMPMLERMLLNFIKEGFHLFYISTHYMAEKIRDYFGNGEAWNVTIQYVHEETPLGTGGALGLLPADLPDLPLLMINGDILTNISFGKLLNFHMNQDADATMCVREYEYQVPYGVVTAEGNRISGMVEKPVQCFHVNAGIYVLSPDIVKCVQSNCRIDMPTLLEQHIALNKNISMYPIHDYWLDIGRMDDFQRAQFDVAKLAVHDD
ncbi:nucleotidyltransferase family protein [Halodesulfovibrio aestuarii]|uniref:nucleotidyltransferase family protein n=1 Tax=Halodesulfovibrio aestuarii TaxID=126333 RepID=UPI00040F72A7